VTKEPSKPTPITRADCATLASLKDARLSGVTYHYLPPADGTYYAGGEEGVDCDLAAVDLHLGDRGTMAITWAMAGELEGLAILERESYSGIGTEVLDAAEREAWREHIGARITSVGASWHISGESCPESLWALRLSFAVGSIVIALGTTYPRLDYMPDELVVVFDLSIARSYKPRHVSDSSWGAPIEPK
jgi:GNAT superfamily N-acetyltransferase